jgi:DNA-directed RNA polymerase subunit M/transcription elongation factor TFIIS
MTEFAVECPKCKHEAAITVSSPWFLDSGKLVCSHCTHSEAAADLIRYKVSVRRNCDTCGKLISKVIPHSKEPVDAFAIPCPSCGEVRIYKPRNEPYTQPYNDPSDGLAPIFGLPLWLQGSIRGNLFWAYNRQHLYAIKEYVGAKLRERQTTTHTTMVERLPQFIKDAKNRDAILKLIEKLERKQPTAP